MDRSEGFQRQLSKTKTQLKASKPQQAFLLSVFYAMTPHLTYALFLHGQEGGMDDNSEVVKRGERHSSMESKSDLVSHLFSSSVFSH